MTTTEMIGAIVGLERVGMPETFDTVDPSTGQALATLAREAVDLSFAALNRQRREFSDLLHPADELASDRALGRLMHTHHKRQLLEDGE